jgi:hypothetical protein
LLPDPVPGTWVIDIGNLSVWRETGPAKVTTEDAEYAVTVRMFNTPVRLRSRGTSAVSLDVENRGAGLLEPAVDVSAAVVRSHERSFLPSGFPNTFELNVPEGTGTLTLRAGAHDPSGSLLELYLYECSTGECFLHDSTIPAAYVQRMTVRSPKAGRWVAAVNAAPFPIAAGGFTLEEVISMPAQRHALRHAAGLPAGARLTQIIPLPRTPANIAAGTVHVELVDLALLRGERERLWLTLPQFPPFRQSPAALGGAIYRPPAGVRR